MTKLPFVYIVFCSPENKRKYGDFRRFDNAHQLARQRGYPDALVYLYATGQISGWCEMASDEDAAKYERSEFLRLRNLQLRATSFLTKGIAD